MDPDTVLEEIRDTVERITRILDEPQQGDDLSRNQEVEVITLCEELIGRVGALDNWLNKGGFLPEAWERKK